MYFITTKRMLEVCFSAHPNIQYRTSFFAALFRFSKIDIVFFGVITIKHLQFVK